MSQMMRQNTDGTWSPAVPEPLWVRSWRTLFRLHPACWPGCGIFADRPAYDAHYLAEHASPPPVCGHRNGGYFCAKTRRHGALHESCGGTTWDDE